MFTPGETVMCKYNEPHQQVLIVEKREKGKIRMYRTIPRISDVTAFLPEKFFYAIQNRGMHED